MLEQLSTVIIHLIATTGYFGITLLMTLESALIPIPSEVTMPFSGFLVSKGQLSFVLVVLAGTAGNLIGSLISYGVGYFFEESVLLRLIKQYGKFLLLSPHEFEKAMKWFRNNGDIVTLLARMLPGVRTFISLPAGMSQMNILKFSFYTVIGSLLWSTILTYIGFYLVTKWQILGLYFRKFDIFIGIILIIALFLYIT